MKLQDLTLDQIADFAKNTGGLGDANFLSDKLARLRRRFALAHARHQLALDLEDCVSRERGAVTVTIAGPTGTLTFDGYDVFNEAGILSGPAAATMQQIADDILDVVNDMKDETSGFGPEADNDPHEIQRRQLFAMCMPEEPAAIMRPLHAEVARVAAEKAA